MNRASFLRHAVLALTVLALLYAAAAGLRTVGDFDIGWQMATGRYIVENHRIPSTDVFSYTARGAPWIYPPLSALLFYGAYAIGGFSALSWLGMAACVGTVALLCRHAGIVTAALALTAVPAIAFRTAARADLFTTVLFAAVLSLLWHYHRGGRAFLWLLPWLMAAWINLHLGFVAGLALLTACVAVELLELAFASRRGGAQARLRRIAPWLAVAAGATLLNPWGPWLYAAVVRQNRIMSIHSAFIGEWSGVLLTAARLREAFQWRSPDSAYWWLLAAAAAGAGVALARKRLGAALLLVLAAYLSVRYFRFQALFAAVTVVVGGAELDEWLGVGNQRAAASPSETAGDAQAVAGGARRLRPVLAGGLLLAGALWLVAIRVSDLASNRYYLSAGDLSLFGPGVTWWYPERAAAFLLREGLPGNIFHDYNLGGYLIWRLGPRHPVYIDGRAVPYGAELFFRHRALFGEPPDSPEWQREADARGINTLIFSVARYAGLGSIPLQAFCESQAWRPVYLDETAVILLRNRPDNARWIERLQINCATVPFVPPPARAGGWLRARHDAELFNFYANAGSVLYVLARDAEAFNALERARRIYPYDPNLFLTLGQLYQATGRTAEVARAYEESVRLKETDMGWYALGRIYAATGRNGEAVQAIRRSAALSVYAYERYRALGHLYLNMRQPSDALAAFQKADQLSPFRGEAAPAGREFGALLAVGRARAWRMLGDLSRAVDYQRQATELTPGDPARWQELADLYQAQGRTAEAERARNQADQLR